MFQNKKKSSYTVIIGCGRLGANLAGTLSDEGEDILIMDRSKDAFRKLPTSFGGLAVEGDGTDFICLKEAQIEKAATIVAVTNHDNINIMIAQIAKELFRTECVIARLYDPERECVYREFGVDTICPAVLSAKEIDKLLSKRMMGGRP
ncbi:MAG: TrkA family potassium uptake protein [Eubacterium sp.]|nr:TrkA family potassium uptake protein [Eubacterium sp.]